MNALFCTLHRISPALLRFTLGVVLLWIGGLKFAEPEPVVKLLEASLPFLAFTGVAYALGVLEVGAAAALFFGVGLRWVGLLMIGLFAGTLTIFVVAPGVSFGEAGFPYLSLAGEFLVKDLVLLAASIAIAGFSAAGMGEARSMRSGATTTQMTMEERPYARMSR